MLRLLTPELSCVLSLLPLLVLVVLQTCGLSLLQLALTPADRCSGCWRDSWVGVSSSQAQRDSLMPLALAVAAAWYDTDSGRANVLAVLPLLLLLLVALVGTANQWPSHTGQCLLRVGIARPGNISRCAQ